MASRWPPASRWGRNPPTSELAEKVLPQWKRFSLGRGALAEGRRAPGGHPRGHPLAGKADGPAPALRLGQRPSEPCEAQCEETAGDDESSDDEEDFAGHAIMVCMTGASAQNDTRRVKHSADGAGNRECAGRRGA